MKKKFFLHCLVASGALLLCSGCVSVASSPNPRFYMAASMSKEQLKERFDITPGAIVAVGPVNIPLFQDRPQIVTKNENGTLNFAQFDRWAEPLDSAITRMLSDDMSVMLPAANFQLFPCNFAIPVDYQVVVDIVQLDSCLEKNMMLSAQWTIIDAKTRKMILTKRSQFVQAIEPRNYLGLSHALSQEVASLSREIAQELSGASKQPKRQAKDETKQP